MRFIKYNPDSDMAKYLHTKPIANHLANIIATRARRSDCLYTKLKTGQCFLGDYKKIGLTEQQYRTGKELLERIKYATFHGTNKGTVASLVSIEVYDLNTKLPNGRSNGTKDTPATDEATDEQRLTKKAKELKKEQELKKKDIVDFLDVFEFFKSCTGKQVQTKDTASLIRRSNKYKSINARLDEGATVEQCKAVIQMKYKEWKDNPKMERYIRFETIFNKTKFESYLDELGEGKSNNPNYTPPYTIPEFESKEKRFHWFLNRFNKYRPHLPDQSAANTTLKKRALYKQDAEQLCYELEQTHPELQEIQT